MIIKIKKRQHEREIMPNSILKTGFLRLRVRNMWDITGVKSNI